MTEHFVVELDLQVKPGRESGDRTRVLAFGEPRSFR